MLPLALDAQFGTPYPRSAGFDTDTHLIHVDFHQWALIILVDLPDDML